MGRNVFQSFATFSGNGVPLIVDTQQLDKCNNNLSEENEALGKCRSKASESLSKHSSNSSSGPVSSSSATQSSSSDVVSMTHVAPRLDALPVLCRVSYLEVNVASFPHRNFNSFYSCTSQHFFLKKIQNIVKEELFSDIFNC